MEKSRNINAELFRDHLALFSLHYRWERWGPLEITELESYKTKIRNYSFTPSPDLFLLSLEYDEIIIHNIKIIQILFGNRFIIAVLWSVVTVRYYLENRNDENWSYAAKMPEA